MNFNMKLSFLELKPETKIRAKQTPLSEYIEFRTNVQLNWTLLALFMHQ